MKAGHCAAASSGAGQVVPSAGAGQEVPSAGAGQVVPSSGAGQVVPSSGAGKAVPSSGAGQAVPSSGAGPVVPSSGAGQVVPSSEAVDAENAESLLPTPHRPLPYSPWPCPLAGHCPAHPRPLSGFEWCRLDTDLGPCCRWGGRS